ncbi:MAG TPA: leucyl aminopeptidase family protein [Ferrovibrio sp.]|uniref:leucyl aminopeptidase family protein n=1 Tax=Ferrovibrio sp. TaxID=1917215 RepID=UPI002B4AAF4D|nr:leucyl aminopeptidase family protein [Ferrovibrio sp.]HLT78636.1 leucyl aminopeptidase family protein [Ferrovibrio sp.]
MTPNLIAKSASPVPVETYTAKQWAARAAREKPNVAGWAAAQNFKGKAGQVLVLPDSRSGKPARVLAGIADTPDLWSYAAIAAVLPAGEYRLADTRAGDAAALGWALSSYRFDRYRKSQDTKPGARLVWPAKADRRRVSALYDGIVLARDLINTPSSDMGPAELAEAARGVAMLGNAQFNCIIGDDLLEQNYPMIHAVGRASQRLPRLIDIVWGNPKHPKLTLVGKGVCFDTGGLDIKPSSGMLLMKKDMGGAAIVLGLAATIMALQLPVRLRVLIGAVENSISGNAMRPGDVLQTRKGITVEVGNTDAEGRLVLGDLLAEADAEKPDWLIDCATLTGAARVAVGPDLPAMYSTDDAMAEALLSAGIAAGDPLWRMPLHKPYRDYIEGKVADITNSADTPFAGSITAALFLKEFVDKTKCYAHLDLFAWNGRARSGRPVGGEATGLRALFTAIENRYRKR